ncbi:MAG: tetratricopeptide repeat protein, partial [Xanthomonadales bacterium]|nr:tetratricopeptide repeat protein [Xanthomonadales bacterium]
AALAALQMARARLEAGQVDIALNLYRFVAENGTPGAMRMVGRERLARVLLDQGQAEEALQLIESESDAPGFEAAFAEVRGDILSALGRDDDAVAAYQEALDNMEAGIGDRAYLELKLRAAGGTPAGAESEDGNEA